MAEQPLAASTASVRAGHMRFLVLGLVFINIIINYIDRTNLSVAATQMAADLKFTPLQMGLIFSAFGWIYAALQIPGGFLIDRLGSRIIYSVGLFVWLNRPGFPGECFVCELRLPDHRFRWKR
ncbi:MFS transporter, partial [Martelella alba]